MKIFDNFDYNHLYGTNEWTRTSFYLLNSSNIWTRKRVCVDVCQVTSPVHIDTRQYIHKASLQIMHYYTLHQMDFINSLQAKT